MSPALRRKAAGAVAAGGIAWTFWGAAFPDPPGSAGHQQQLQGQYRQAQQLEGRSRAVNRSTLQQAIEADALRSAEVRRAEASSLARTLVRRP